MVEDVDLFSRVRILAEKISSKKAISKQSQECLKILSLEDEINALLRCAVYVAKSDYVETLPEYKSTVEYFRVLQSSKMLKNYCNQNGIDEQKVLNVIEQYDHLEELVDAANEKYLERSNSF